MSSRIKQAYTSFHKAEGLRRRPSVYIMILLFLQARTLVTCIITRKCSNVIEIMILLFLQARTLVTSRKSSKGH